MSEKQNLFDLIPVISDHVTTENEGELVVLTFPRFKSKFIQKYLVREKSKFVRVRLETNGTAVWQLIDGKRSVAKIAESLAEHFQHEEKYEYRVAEYISQLYRQGFVKNKVEMTYNNMNI